jgi:hypothetical protein
MEDKSNTLHVESLQGAAGRLLFNQHVKEKVRSNPVDYSCVELSQQDGAYMKLIAGGKVRVQAPSVMSLNSKKDTFFNVEGHRQDIVGLGHLSYVKGDVKFLVGPHDKDAKDRAKQLVDIAANINQTALEAGKGVQDELIPCSACESGTLAHNALEDTKVIFKQARSWLTEQMPFISSLFSVLDAITDIIVLPFKMIKMGAGRNKKTDSCGPSCKSGKTKSLRLTVQEITKTKKQLIEAQTENINKLHRDVGAGGNFIASAAGALYLQSGLRRNESKAYTKKNFHSHVYRFVQNPGVNAMTYSTEGNCEQVIYTKPISLTKGEMVFNCGEQLIIKAGSPGIDTETSGHYALKAGSIELLATEGEIVIGSGNLTVLKGANVRIEGKGKAGADGISLEADKVMVHGALSIRGEIAIKGGVATDGEISCTRLNVPSMKQEVSVKDPSQWATYVQSLIPQVTRNGHLAQKMTETAWQPGELLTGRGLKDMIKEIYDSALGATVLDPIQSGFCLIPPVVLIKGPTTAPIWNYYHNHSLSCLKTSGSVSTPKATHKLTNAGVFASRSVASPIPVPPPYHGTFQSGGDASEPGPCGGGGLFAKKMEARNLRYGVDPIDPFQGTNMIDRYNQNSNLVTSLTGSTGFFPPVENPPFSLVDPILTDKDKLDC